MLEVELSAGYGSRTTLRDMRFDLEAGDRVGLVGGSGAGKSTLVLALFGLLPWRKGWARGRVLLHGRDLLRCGERELRDLRGREVALVPQNPASSLNPALTLHTQFRELWRAHTTSEDGFTARVAMLLRRVGLPGDSAFLQRKPAEISVGQAQRLVIALALLHHPSVLVADEPTSALDVCTQQEVVGLLLELCQEESMTLLYVSHDLLTVFLLCDRMLVVDGGKLVDQVRFATIASHTFSPMTRRMLSTLPVAPEVFLHNTLTDRTQRALTVPATPQLCRSPQLGDETVTLKNIQAASSTGQA